jgi:hypothetical protein
MTDSWGDGWGFYYTVADLSGTTMFSGAPADDVSSESEALCLDPGQYTFTIPEDNDDGYGSEVGYELCAISGSGVDVSETFYVYSDGTCGSSETPGSSDSAYSYSYSSSEVYSYSYDGDDDDATCAVGTLSVTVTMMDSWGDGWDSYVYDVTDAGGELLYTGSPSR